MPMQRSEGQVQHYKCQRSLIDTFLGPGLPRVDGSGVVLQGRKGCNNYLGSLPVDVDLRTSSFVFGRVQADKKKLGWRPASRDRSALLSEVLLPGSK